LQLREALDFPVPRILTYSLDPTNPVGVEYIIEEKAAGQTLGNIWRNWPRDAQLDLVAHLVDLEAKLSSVSFQHHGCIYFKADLEAKGIVAQSLEAKISTHEFSPTELDHSLMDKFAIGPLNQALLWDTKSSTMALDRGPCEYITV
jgi:hypothetical protein